MRYRKKYGARGLLEFNMMLRSGNANVKITFTGGRMGNNGVLAATYVTDSPAIQLLIESSPSFRSGKVFLYEAPEKLDDEPATVKEEDSPTAVNTPTNESQDRGNHQESPSPDGRRPDDYV